MMSPQKSNIKVAGDHAQQAVMVLRTLGVHYGDPIPNGLIFRFRDGKGVQTAQRMRERKEKTAIDLFPHQAAGEGAFGN